jgi:hypothetical protein
MRDLEPDLPLLQFTPSFMKLDLRWDIQQPIKIAGLGSIQPKSSAAALEWYESFVSSAVHCCHVLPFIQCESRSVGCKIYLATLVDETKCAKCAE